MTNAEKTIKIYTDILINFIEEVNDYAHELYPCERDYYYLGVTERMILDAKKDIADRLWDIAEKYEELYCNAESDTDDIH